MSSAANSNPRNRVVVDKASSSSNASYEAPEDEAGVPREPINSRANTLAISEGEGALGREATWDDFPNGRWGDARSPGKLIVICSVVKVILRLVKPAARICCELFHELCFARDRSSCDFWLAFSLRSWTRLPVSGPPKDTIFAVFASRHL